MEVKRATELTLCALLREALPDLTFVASKGGGGDVTPVWQPDYPYNVGDILRPTNTAFNKVVVVFEPGMSGSTEPAFDDVVGSIFMGPPSYETTAETAIATAVDSFNVLPPFCAVMCDPSEKTVAGEDTAYIRGTLAWITRHDATTVVAHSNNFKRIYDALSRVGKGYDILRRVMIHGVDITSTNEFTDAQKEAHGDTIEFTVGVTAKPG